VCPESLDGALGDRILRNPCVAQRFAWLPHTPSGAACTAQRTTRHPIPASAAASATSDPSPPAA